MLELGKLIFNFNKNSDNVDLSTKNIFKYAKSRKSSLICENMRRHFLDLSCIGTYYEPNLCQIRF